jgi:hypothetical protein
MKAVAFTFALLTTLSASLAKNLSNKCGAESGCISEKCSTIYEKDAADFPISVKAIQTAGPVASTIVFTVCYSPCKQDDPFCKPLDSFHIRLNDKIIASPDLIWKASPPGKLVTGCGPSGPGYTWSTTYSLNNITEVQNGNQGEICESFSLKIAKDDENMGASNGQPLDSSFEAAPITSICQQGLSIVTSNDDILFNQNEVDSSTSCLFTITTIEDNDTNTNGGVGILSVETKSVVSIAQTVEDRPSIVPILEWITPSVVDTPPAGPDPLYTPSIPAIGQVPSTEEGTGKIQQQATSTPLPVVVIEEVPPEVEAEAPPPSTTTTTSATTIYSIGDGNDVPIDLLWTISNGDGVPLGAPIPSMMPLYKTNAGSGTDDDGGGGNVTPLPAPSASPYSMNNLAVGAYNTPVPSVVEPKRKLVRKLFN